MIVERVRRCLLGDALAWRELVGAYYRLIYFLCYKSTNSPCDAEDLTQDIFLKVFCNLSRFDSDKGSFQTWLKNVTRNHLVDHFRANHLTRSSDSLDTGATQEDDGRAHAYRLVDPRPSPEQSFRSLEVRTRIYAALAQVSPTSRDAVILCDLEDRDYLEAAEILRIPVGTVKSRLNRGRAELARILAGNTAPRPVTAQPRTQSRVRSRRRFTHTAQLQPSLA
jgi:RNA polymerase sigma-70 factor, ECF subfamily